MSATPMHSPLWHRVEQLKLRLKPGVEIRRQVLRGAVWYVARDPMAANAHRLSSGVYALLMRMNGQRSLGSIWSDVVGHFGERAPSQDQVITAIGQLYTADLIHVQSAVDQRELSERAHRLKQQQWTQRYQNPLFFRLPLFNPDRFLDRTQSLVAPLFSGLGLLLWLAVALWLLVQVGLNWDGLTRNITDRVLAPENLVVTVLIFPIIKILHEFGHAYATKVFGGAVPEIGIMFLVLTPAPYVDASASALFADKRVRIAVAAAGMMVEIVLAALAMLVWTSAEPGLVRAISFNVMLIAGVSTIVFNGNPLLRFDGYFILSDLLEIPNLASRSTQFWMALFQRHLLGIGSAPAPVTADGERGWFILYAPMAFTYRLIVLASVTLFLGSHFFFVGIVLALWTLGVSLVWPLIKALKFVLTSPVLARTRWRAVSITVAAVLMFVALVAVVPLPYGTVARGVVWLPQSSELLAQANGTVERYLRAPGSRVSEGEPLIALDDPYAEGQRRLAAARLLELRHRLTAAETTSPVEIELVRRRVEYAESELAEAEQRFDRLTVRSPVDGVFMATRGEDLIHAYAARGALLGYVIPETRPVLRVAVPETEIDTVRTLARSVAVRFDSALDVERTDLVELREAPGATRKLPSPALGAPAGGPFAVDTADRDKTASITPFFVIDLEMTGQLPPQNWGERCHVRFDHGATPLALQLYRTLRQIFLSRLNV